MEKYFGKIGYASSTETSPGVWMPEITEYEYYGDVVRNLRRMDQNTEVNGPLTVSNSISIVADAFAYDHFFEICYATWMGVKWKVTNVEVNRPRLVLTLGGVYCDEQ